MSSGNGAPFGPSPVDPARERMVAAIVALVGAYGYEETSVEMVCERARTRRTHFERCFAGKQDCFLWTHDELCDELCDCVELALVGMTSWHDRLWAVGWAAMRFLRDDPVRARFLIVEVNAAGEGGQVRRDRILQRLADVLDGGREDLEERATISRCTAEILAGAIYGTVAAKIEAGCLERGEDFLSELVYMAVLPYLGSRAAEDELLVQALR